MATSTTNYSFTLPEVGGDTDQWGTQLNSNWTSLDSTLKNVADSVGDAVTLTGNDYLTISGQAITVGSVDLTTDVTGTLPVGSGGTGLSSLGTANQVLAVNSTADGLEFQTVSSSGTVTNIAVTGSDGIEVDSGSPVTTSGTIALGINSTALSTHLGLGTAATTDSTAYATSTQGSTADSALQDVADDTTPQLGGNLDVNGNSIVSASAGNINITPDGAGKIVLDGLSWPILDGVSGYVLKTDGSGNLSWIDKNSGAVTSLSVSAADEITVSTIVSTDSNGAKSYSVSLTLDATNTATHLGLGALATQDTITESQINDFGTYQTADQALTDISSLAVTDGNIIVGNGTNWVAESGATARASLGLTIGTDVEAYSSTNADYADTTANFTGTLQNGGSNVVVDSDIGSSVQAYDADTAKYDDTTANFTGTLQNGGSSVLVDSDIGSTVQAAGSYLSDVVSDTTPQLGGSLDVNGNSIVSASAGDIAITPDTTGKIILDGLSWPTSDGSADQVLKTDGSGNLSFVNQSALVVGTANYIEHSSTVSDSLAISAGTNRMYVGRTDFSSGGVTMAGTLVVAGGYANFTSASALNVTGTLNVVS